MVSFNEPANKFFHFVNSYHESYGVPDDIFDLYHIGRQLGSGAQGMVRLVIDRRTCETYAMKQVQKNGSANTLGYLNDERINREVDIMRSIEHPNIIRCHEVIMKPDSVYMVRILAFQKCENNLNVFL